MLWTELRAVKDIKTNKFMKGRRVDFCMRWLVAWTLVSRNELKTHLRPTHIHVGMQWPRNKPLPLEGASSERGL